MLVTTAGDAKLRGNYGYDPVQQFVTDISPVMGGWVDVLPSSKGYEIVDSTTPPFVRSKNFGVNGSATLRYPLQFLHRGNLTAQPYTIVSFTFRYIEAAAGDVLSVILWKVKADGTGTGVQVANASPATSASFATHTSTPNHLVDPTYYYYFGVLLAPGSAVDDVRIADFRVTLGKSAVE